MTGADVVYKDVVEPLESVSVTITPTDRKDITDFGDIEEVREGPQRQLLASGNNSITDIPAAACWCVEGTPWPGLRQQLSSRVQPTGRSKDAGLLLSHLVNGVAHCS